MATTRDYSSAAREGRQVLATTGVADAGRVTVTRPRDSILSTALGTLARVGGQYAAAKADQQVQESYLAGQRARATGEAVESIETNPLMRPFVRSGYAQQDYQMAQADFATKAQTYLAQEGRTKSPEEFQAWVAENAKPVSASIGDNMSTADRVRAVRSQADMERQLVQAHAMAYVKYGQEQYAQRLTAGGNAHITAYMQAVQAGDAQAASTAMGNITDYAVTILEDEKLPLSIRQSTATDMLRATVAETGSAQAVQELLRSGKLDGLDAQQRMQIDAQIKQSQQGKLTADRLNFSDKYAQFSRRLALGEAVSYEEFQSIKADAQRVGMPASFFDSANEDWYKSGMNSDVAITAQALARGDLGALMRTGKSVDEGLNAVSQYAFQQAGGDVLKAWAYTLDVGMRYGTVPKSVRDGVSTALRSAITSPDTQTPEQQKLLAGTLDMIGGLQQADPARAAVVLQGFDADTQSVLVGVTTRMQGGTSGLDALKETVAAQSAFNKASPEAKGAQLANLTKDVANVVKSEFTSPWYKGLFNFATGNSSWEGNNFVQGQLNAAVATEARRLGSLPAYAGALAGNPEGTQALVKAAAANVKARALDIGVDKYVGGVPHSLLVLPSDTPMANVFGIAAGTPLVKEQLGALVAEETRKNVPKGYAAAYAYSPVTGKVMQTVYSEDGTKAAQYEVDTRSIGQKYTKQYQDRIARERNGVVLNVPDGAGGKVPFTLSGNGPGGMTSDEVIQFRRDLVKSEGLRLAVYKDTQGVLTAGVGQNLKALGDDYLATLPEGRRIPADVAQKWFNDASYKALSSAHLLTQQYGFDGNARVQAALGKAVYQLGSGGWGQFNEAEKAIVARDPVALEKSIKGSKWYQQTPGRAQEFLDAVVPELSKPWTVPYTTRPVAGRNTM